MKDNDEKKAIRLQIKEKNNKSSFDQICEKTPSLFAKLDFHS